MAEFYYGQGSERKGPIALEELKNHPIGPDTLVWREGMPQWAPAGSVPELAFLFPGAVPPPSNGFAAPPPPPPPYMNAPMGYNPSDVSSKKILCGILAIVIGHLGIHKFILGYTGAGVIMLLVTVLTCGMGGIVMWVIGLIEGINYLTKSDPEFHQIYIANRKEWF